MDKLSHLNLLKDALKRSEREAKAWRRIGMPAPMLQMHAQDDECLRHMIKKLEDELKASQQEGSEKI